MGDCDDNGDGNGDHDDRDGHGVDDGDYSTRSTCPSRLAMSMSASKLL